MEAGFYFIFLDLIVSMIGAVLGVVLSMFVSLIGGVISAVLSILFSTKLLEMMLSSAGVAKLYTEYTFASIILPVVVITSVTMLFSFIASRRVKKISVRSLITE